MPYPDHVVPVPDSLQACFTKHEEPDSGSEPPEKRRKLDKFIYEDIAEYLLPSYLALAHIELKITFSSPPLNGPSISSCYQENAPIKIPVIISKTEQLFSDRGYREPRYRIQIGTSFSDVVLDETIDFRTRHHHDPTIPASLPSIYRGRGTSPTACSMSTMRRVKGDDLSFILETKVLWKDTVQFRRNGFLQRRAFSTYLPGAPPDVAPRKLTNRPPFQQHTRESTWSPSEFYENVHVPPKSSDLPSKILADLVQCQLFPFQRRTVRWLLEREGVEVLPDGNMKYRQVSSPSALPDSFSQITDADGRTCFVSHLFRVLTSDLKEWPSARQILRGGILAEEMGLVKLLKSSHGLPILRQWPSLTESGATLIITPPTILEQWKQEIATHAPHLRCMYYRGIYRTKLSNEDFVKKLAASDVVLTTYNILQGEIHYTEDPPDRSLRSGKKAVGVKSPLVQISWWRVCIDEAQMIETGVTHAAKVARIIPRHNVWAVTGTPLRKDMNDLLGLFLFLRYEPLCGMVDVWKRLYQSHKPLFREIIGRIVLRHNKDTIGDELQLPRQKRIVITIPFTAVEEQHYDQLFEQMCDECGLDASGAPRIGNWDWDPNIPYNVEKMRRWLTRLRQACLHPEAGGPGRKAFGPSSSPLRSVDEVLDVMIDQNETRIRAEERSLLLSQIRRGQLLENAGKPKEALKLWQEALALAESNVKDSRVQFETERMKEQSAEPNGVQILSGDEDDVDDGKGEKNAGLAAHRHRLRNALEVEHICKFFIANAYYQIKTNTELTNPDSEEFIALEKLEEENYEAAKLIRKEMLADINHKANRSIKRLQAKVDRKGLVNIPKMTPRLDFSGLESRRLLGQLEDFCEAMNKLTQQFTEWREHALKLLLKSLVDEDDNNAELKGDEYESSTQHQDEMYVYMEALRALFADYHDAITGQTNLLIGLEVKKGLERAGIGEGPSPKLYISMMKTRENLRVPNDIGSLRGIVSELRSLSQSLESQEARGNTRARAELSIVNRILQDSGQISSEHAKASSELEREVQLFRDVMNRRLEYYRQLQQISDTVAPYDEDSKGEPLDDVLFGNSLDSEHKIQEKISSLRSKHRYLIHLRDESGAQESARICVICQSNFEIGVLTVCGHKYCKDCLQFWWRQHRTCPMCKIRLKSTDFYQITYKPTELVVQEEKSTGQNLVSDHPLKNSIYSDISTGVLKEIRNIDLGASFGTKIDTLARHLLWLRQHDPGAKSIVFSQYKPFLGILAGAFSHFKIGFSSIDSHDGVEQFKREPSIECFLLHAKAHASGLNLVNATHVFLCEPLINTAIELQAIARVHRIGQHRETTVWMYLVSDSVEESIYDISVSRRLAHIARKRKQHGEKTSNLDSGIGEEGGVRGGDGDEPMSIETDIEAANSLELQDAKLGDLMAGNPAEGERVPEGDLWQCLFAKTSRRGKRRGNGGNVGAMQVEVERLLRGEAAEGRIEGV
ncbi:hypothetical protein ACJ72_02170 [Emergomyces africanus]|uniref:RING-type domain-containing protein n=1 Tax=Emergomyces africanus TaxID=1955775 RepID=A0A1B7P3A1_9EURO|nr:hypothetical protein ACJ72_02170 [Emergomyces africanus]